VIITVKKATGWVKTWGGNYNGWDYGDEVATDMLGNIYVTGHFYGTVDFDPSSGADIHISAGFNDVFLCKYDTNGKFLWCRTWGGSGEDTVHSLMADKANFVYCAGRFENTVDFNPGSGTDLHTSNGDADCSISKFDPDGIFIWARTWGGSEFDYTGNLDFDNAGNVYCAGTFRTVVDFNPGTGTDTRASNGNSDSYISKFDSDGNYYWVANFGGPGEDSCNGFVIDYSDNLYASGWFSNSVDFDPGPGVDIHVSNGLEDCYLTKFTTDGFLTWARTWGGAGDDQSHCVSIDRDNNVFAGSYFKFSVDFDPSLEEDWHVANGTEWDTGFSKFDTDGNFLFAKTFGGPYEDETYQVSNDEAGNIYIAGFFEGLVDLDPGLGVEEHNSQGKDAFLSKFSPIGDFIWARTWGGSGLDFAAGLPRDCTNVVYVSGLYTGTVDFDPGPGYDWHISNGYEDAYLMKLFPNGYWE